MEKRRAEHTPQGHRAAVRGNHGQGQATLAEQRRCQIAEENGQVLELKADNHDGSYFENISNLWHFLGTEFSHGIVKLQSS